MTRKYGSTYAHLHLPRFKRGDSNVISVKTGDAPTYYLGHLALRDVVFCVREGGRQETLRTGRKNVHAWVTGEIVQQWEIPADSSAWRKLRYRPQDGPHFYDAETGQPVRGAAYVWMTCSQVYGFELY